MKILIILLALLIFPIISVEAFAQTSDTFIFVKNILRDSNGNLITTHDVTKIGYIDAGPLDKFLDEESSQSDPVMVMDGKQMQIIERSVSLDFDSKNVLSDTTLNISKDDGSIRTLIRLIHDGIPVDEGDQITTIWTFIRPV